MRKLTVLAIALGALLFSRTSHADPVVFGHNVYLNNAFNSTSLTLIPASANTNGAVIQTMVLGCNSGVMAIATPPTGTAVWILYCQGAPSSGAATLPAPVYVPAGWSVSLSNSSTATAGVNMTYDLK
jgi:hypothetical protein